MLESKSLHYGSVKSEFTKNLIRSASWRDNARRKYIDDLIEIERYVLEGPKGFGDAMRAHMIKEQYRGEYNTIFKELKPREYEQYLRDQERRREELELESERLRKQKEAESKRLRKEWLEIGGIE